MRKKKTMAIGKPERAERESRERGSDVITRVFRSRAELKLENKEENTTLNAMRTVNVSQCSYCVIKEEM